MVAGNLLIDSESRIKAGVRAASAAPEKDPVCGMEVDRGKAEAAGRTRREGGHTYYFCSDQCKARLRSGESSGAG